MLPLQPGVLVPLRPERRLPRFPLWLHAVERSTDLFTRARARARGVYSSNVASPSLPRTYGTTWTAPSARERRVEGGGACLGHAHSVSGRKGRARARLTGSGTLGDPFATCVTLDECRKDNTSLWPFKDPLLCGEFVPLTQLRNLCVCVCVCVCARALERERERESGRECVKDLHTKSKDSEVSRSWFLSVGHSLSFSFLFCEMGMMITFFGM